MQLSKLKITERRIAALFGEITDRVAFQRHYRNGRCAGWELITDNWERVWADEEWRFMRRDAALSAALREAESHYGRALRIRALLQDSVLPSSAVAYHPDQGLSTFGGHQAGDLPEGWVLDLRSPEVAGLLADQLLSLQPPPSVALAA